MRRFLVFCVLSVSGFIQTSLAKHVSLHGYVTAVHSSTSFEMDDYKILDRTKEERERILSEGRDYQASQLRPGSLRIGLEVEVKGDYDRKTGEVNATSIRAVNDDSNPDKSVEGIGLVEDKASLQRSAQGWSGRFRADGETLIVTTETQISVKRSRSEKKERLALGLETDDGSAFSPEDIDLDTFAHYVGMRQGDRSIVAARIEFRQDRAAVESAWGYFEPKVIYQAWDEPGTLHVGEKEYELFSSTETPIYLDKLGNSLVPTHYRDLPENSPGKVKFKYFLIKSDPFTVDAYPNGVIVISANVFDVFDNEAQLAFVLSREIARVVEKQSWTASRYKQNERTGIAATGAATAVVLPGAPLVGYLVDRGVTRRFVHGLQSQSDRVGMEYMLAAGYDPNRAVEAWRVLQKKRAQGPFWGDADQNLMRRTYLQSELQLDYANQDFSNLKHDSPDFHATCDAVKAARVRAKSKKR